MLKVLPDDVAQHIAWNILFTDDSLLVNLNFLSEKISLWYLKVSQSQVHLIKSILNIPSKSNFLEISSKLSK